MNRSLTTNERRGLWSIFWRMLVIGPILMPLGLGVFIGTLAMLFYPLIVVVGFVIEGRYVMAVVILVAWILFWRWTRRLRHWFLAGMEYASL